jgi:hypothetical protein
VKARDVALVAAVLAVVGVAVADAFRDPAPAPDPVETEAAPVPVTEPEAPPDPPASFPRGELEGSLVFTDADDCRVRELDLARAEEQRLPRIGASCHLWSPRTGRVIAYGLGNPGPGGDTVAFRFVDLARPETFLGGFRALFGFIAWSPDGRRAAWCGESRRGVDLELGGDAHLLPDCPNGYTREGRVAFARGQELRVGGRVVLRAEGGITNLHYGRDGSLALVLDGRRLVRRDEAGHVTGAVGLPPRLEGRLPLFSPDTCAALFRAEGQVEVVDLGCFAGQNGRTFFGTEAAWSPDGRWIAVAERATIAFYRADEGGPPLRWPAAASELAWRA